MKSLSREVRKSLREETLRFLDRLRTVFPLEQRIARADPQIQDAYTLVLTCWMDGRMPPSDFLSPAQLHALHALDAVAPGRDGIGCYPFSADSRGISVLFSGYRVNAMCAIDALAVARLVASAVQVEARCATCLAAVHIEVQADGSLRHDDTPATAVLWKQASRSSGSCSDTHCRDLVFLCEHCKTRGEGDRLTLPQAAAVANAFFGFQHRLVPRSCA